MWELLEQLIYIYKGNLKGHNIYIKSKRGITDHITTWKPHM